MVEIDGISIYMLHDLGQLDLKPEAAGIRVVIYGHSHQPKIEEKNGRAVFQSRERGAAAVSVAGERGKIDDRKWRSRRAEIMTLEQR